MVRRVAGSSRCLDGRSWSICWTQMSALKEKREDIFDGKTWTATEHVWKRRRGCRRRARPWRKSLQDVNESEREYHDAIKDLEGSGKVIGDLVFAQRQRKSGSPQKSDHGLMNDALDDSKKRLGRAWSTTPWTVSATEDESLTRERRGQWHGTYGTHVQTRSALTVCGNGSCSVAFFCIRNLPGQAGLQPALQTEVRQQDPTSVL